MKTIAVFFGGASPEHEISVLTGIQAYFAIDKNTFSVIPVFVDLDGQMYTGKNITETKNYKNKEKLLAAAIKISLAKDGKQIVLLAKKALGSKKTPIDCAFLAFHGAYGEGGSFQGYCETLGIPYTSSNVLGASLAMDKFSMKKIFENEGIPSAKYHVVIEKDFIADKNKTLQEIEKNIHYPLFVKPSNGGSSIGVSQAKNIQELTHALEVAFMFDAKVLIEEAFAKDAEVNISFMGIWNDDVDHSVSEEVYSDAEFLDFENKYQKGAQSKKTTSGSKGMASTNRHIPAEISNELLAKLTHDGEKAFRLLNCAGVVRIDFLVNKKTEEYVLVEVNTIPGSFAYYLWEKSGISFDKLTTKMIDLAFKKHSMQQQKTRKFSPQIFKNL